MIWTKLTLPASFPFACLCNFPLTIATYTFSKSNSWSFLITLWQCCPTERSVVTECSISVLYCTSRMWVTGYLKCGKCGSGTEFFILFDSNLNVKVANGYHIKQYRSTLSISLHAGIRSSLQNVPFFTPYSWHGNFLLILQISTQQLFYTKYSLPLLTSITVCAKKNKVSFNILWSFFQKRFTECLLCVKCCARHWYHKECHNFVVRNVLLVRTHKQLQNSEVFCTGSICQYCSLNNATLFFISSCFFTCFFFCLVFPPLPSLLDDFLWALRWDQESIPLGSLSQSQVSLASALWNPTVKISLL